MVHADFGEKAPLEVTVKVLGLECLHGELGLASRHFVLGLPQQRNTACQKIESHTHSGETGRADQHLHAGERLRPGELCAEDNGNLQRDHMNRKMRTIHCSRNRISRSLRTDCAAFVFRRSSNGTFTPSTCRY